MTTPRLNASQPIVEDDKTMSQVFRNFMVQVSELIPLQGSGSPEGVVEARQYREYIDTAGSSGSIKYIKMQDNIGGDKTKGWVLE